MKTFKWDNGKQVEAEARQYHHLSIIFAQNLQIIIGGNQYEGNKKYWSILQL
jgi:hypothetical protein